MATNITAAHADIVGWAASVLGEDTLSTTVIAETPYSIVIKIDLKQTAVYLKQTPEALFIEAAVISICRNQCGITAIPKVIASNPQLNCFLMTSAGDISLRRLCGGNTERTDVKPDMELTVRALSLYRDLQRVTARQIDTFFESGVPDCRLDKLPTLYRRLVADTALLQDCGLSADQITNLGMLDEELSKKCKALAALDIADCLSHSDLHDDNMLFDTATKAIGIIDWGESTIEHPLLSLATCLRWFSRSYNIKRGSHDYQRLYEACFNGWPLVDAKLAAAVSLAEDLAPLTWALARLRLNNITAQESLTEFEEPDSRFKDGLITFLERMTNREGLVSGN